MKLLFTNNMKYKIPANNYVYGTGVGAKSMSVRASLKKNFGCKDCLKKNDVNDMLKKDKIVDFKK